MSTFSPYRITTNDDGTQLGCVEISTQQGYLVFLKHVPPSTTTLKHLKLLTFPEPRSTKPTTNHNNKFKRSNSISKNNINNSSSTTTSSPHTTITCFDVFNNDEVVVGFDSGDLLYIDAEAKQTVLPPLHNSSIVVMHLYKRSKKFWTADAEGNVMAFERGRGRMLSVGFGTVTAITFFDVKQLLYVGHVDRGSIYVTIVNPDTGEIMQQIPQVCQAPVSILFRTYKSNLMGMECGMVKLLNEDRVCFFACTTKCIQFELNEHRNAASLHHVFCLGTSGQIEIFKCFFSKSKKKKEVPTEPIIYQALAVMMVPGHKIVTARFTSSSTITVVYGDSPPIIETMTYATTLGNIIKGEIAIQPRQPNGNLISQIEARKRKVTKPSKSPAVVVDKIFIPAINSSDDSRLSKIFEISNNQEIVRLIKLLPHPQVLQFIRITVEQIRKGNLSAVMWLKTIFYVHTDFLVGQRLTTDPWGLRNEILHHIENHTDCIRLKGRLELVMSQIEAKKQQTEEQVMDEDDQEDKDEDEEEVEGTEDKEKDKDDEDKEDIEEDEQEDQPSQVVVQHTTNPQEPGQMEIKSEFAMEDTSTNESQSEEEQQQTQKEEAEEEEESVDLGTESDTE